jgi:hypothetical protein
MTGSKIDIKYFCSWWGLDYLGIERMLSKIKDSGFDGVEIGIPFEKEKSKELKRLLDKYKLEVIAHQYQANGNFEEYKKSFSASLLSATEFKPLFVNSHTGKDFWSVEQNLELVDIASNIEEQSGVEILHETHRKHFLFSTFSSKQYFEKNRLFKTTADLSHWTCVSESMLKDQPEIINELISRTNHIHARVGYEEGPQVADPRSKEWDKHLEIFTKWWQRIIDRAIANGKEYITITPEFGPAPYTVMLPFENKPISDFFEINCWMKDYLKDELRDELNNRASK